MGHKKSINGKKIKKLNNSCSDAGTRKSQCLISEVDHPGRIFCLWEEAKANAQLNMGSVKDIGGMGT